MKFLIAQSSPALDSKCMYLLCLQLDVKSLKFPYYVLLLLLLLLTDSQSINLLTYLLTHLLTNYSAHKSPPLDPILSQMHPIHKFPTYFSTTTKLRAGRSRFELRQTKRLLSSPSDPHWLCDPSGLSNGNRRLLEVHLPGYEADHSPPSSAEVKNAWSYTSTHSIRLHGVVLS